ncbi:MAG: hypothetical protein PUC65_14140 [Clostridiales bacterium]|nr:hypothetical protein [Clostridiales bacterium]
MKKMNRYIIKSILGLFFIVSGIGFVSTNTFHETNITAIHYAQSGGFYEKIDRFTVFEDHGVNYYTDMKEVYTISKRDFNKFVAKVQSLHLEVINGYNESNETMFRRKTYLSWT